MIDPPERAPPTRIALADWIAGLRATLLAGGAQAAIQFATLLTGLAVLRLLPIEEYAYYTIINAMVGTLSVLTDGGVSQSVLSQGGKVWHDRAALGGVVAGGLKLRRRFAAIATPVAVAITWILLRKQGASPGTATVLIVCVIPVFLATLAGPYFEIVPRLHQALWPLQRIQVLGSCMRLAAAVGATAVMPFAWAASLASGLVQLWTTRRTSKLALTLADWRRPADPQAWQRMIAYVRRSLPGTIYFAFYGQISVWLISLFGNVDSVAQVGALTRLAMFFNLFASVFALVILPRFARLPERDSAGSVLGRFWQAQAGYAILLSLIVGGVALFPGYVLLVLGSDYRGLTYEVVLMAAGTAFSALAASAHAMAAARGTVVASFTLIASSLLVQAVLILSLQLDTVAGVLWLSALGNAFLWLLHAVNFSLWIRAK